MNDREWGRPFNYLTIIVFQVSGRICKKRMAPMSAFDSNQKMA